MPFRPEHSLVKIDVDKMHTIDTRSVEHLFGMWSVFNKISDAMEDGKRLENLSWRLWNRETFCCCPETHPPTSPLSVKCSRVARAKHIPNASLPALSSISSTESDQDDDVSPFSSPTVRPELSRRDSSEHRSRGREKHITPIDLEKMVISIKEKKSLQPLAALSMPSPTSATPSSHTQTPVATEAPLPAPVYEAPLPTPVYEAPLPTPVSEIPLPAPANEVPQPISHPAAKVAPRPAVEAPRSEPAATMNYVPTMTPAINVPHPLESSASTISSTDSQAIESSSESSSTEMSTHNIVRGFRPEVPSSYRSQTNLVPHQPTPILKTSPQYRPVNRLNRPKKGATFTLGASSGEEESSLDSHMGLNSVSSLSSALQPPPKKHASFRDITQGRAITDSPVFEESDDEDEDDDAFESVIEEDEDSSDWEDDDVVGESGNSSADERKSMFRRVDSQPNLTSRRSLLTTMMHEPDRARALQSAASRSTPALRRSRAASPSGPSATPSPHRREIERSGPSEFSQPQPIIMTTSNTHQPALSPRTTRRNMLSTELTESLRKNLLWERQHKSSNNLAAMKRRHTSHDVKNLKQYPEPQPVMSVKENDKKNYSNEYFHQGLQEYHAKGW